MEGLEKQCFQIISAVGMARSSYIEAIQEAKKANFERAREMIEEGDKSFLQGHEAHAKMIQQEAGGEKVETGLLLIHAEDQLMTTSLMHEMAGQMVEMYRKMYELHDDKGA